VNLYELHSESKCVFEFESELECVIMSSSVASCFSALLIAFKKEACNSVTIASAIQLQLFAGQQMYLTKLCSILESCSE
jgi:hypothetical protein